MHSAHLAVRISAFTFDWMFTVEVIYDNQSERSMLTVRARARRTLLFVGVVSQDNGWIPKQLSFGRILHYVGRTS